MNMNYSYPITKYEKEISIHTVVMSKKAGEVTCHTFFNANMVNYLFCLPEIRAVWWKYSHTLYVVHILYIALLLKFPVKIRSVARANVNANISDVDLFPPYW